MQSKTVQADLKASEEVKATGEMVKAADVKREHDLALAIYGKSLAILRASLGRR